MSSPDLSVWNSVLLALILQWISRPNNHEVISFVLPGLCIQRIPKSSTLNEAVKLMNCVLVLHVCNMGQGTKYPHWGFSFVSLNPFRQIFGYYFSFELSRECIHPRAFQSIIHRTTSTLHILSCWQNKNNNNNNSNKNNNNNTKRC